MPRASPLKFDLKSLSSTSIQLSRRSSKMTLRKNNFSIRSFTIVWLLCIFGYRHQSEIIQESVNYTSTLLFKKDDCYVVINVIAAVKYSWLSFDFLVDLEIVAIAENVGSQWTTWTCFNKWNLVMKMMLITMLMMKSNTKKSKVILPVYFKMPRYAKWEA